MSYLNAFLETEVTTIPQTMDGHVGKYNTLYNAIFWMILIFHIIHYLFDISVNALLRKMRFKEYIRIRLKKSLWYLGFYTCSLLYSSATTWKNNITLPDQYKFYVLDLTEPLSGHMLVGYTLLSAFYASSSMWEGFQCSITSFTYLFLTGFTAFTYYFRYIELTIIFTSIFSIIYVVTELTRCILCVIKFDGVPKILLQSMFCILLATFSVIYFLVIPMNFLLPLGRGMLSNSSSVIMAGLNITLWGWLICEIYSSPLYRLVQHQWHHKGNQTKVPECLGSITECALFLPRDDVAYNLKLIKQEIKERQAKVMALRKPKKRASILFQTLKCVAALNRKVKYRKHKGKTLVSSQSLSESTIENNDSYKNGENTEIVESNYLEKRQDLNDQFEGNDVVTENTLLYTCPKFEEENSNEVNRNIVEEVITEDLHTEY